MANVNILPSCSVQQEGRGKAINHNVVLASICDAALKMIFSMRDLPVTISKNVYTTHEKEIRKRAVELAEQSMSLARNEVWNHLEMLTMM